MLSLPHLCDINLTALGLVAIIDFKTIARWTAVTGTASLNDVFILTPGIQNHQDASKVNDGEYPVCGAMTSGYVFRVENEATVSYLQRVGVPGHLVSISVSRPHSTYSKGIGFAPDLVLQVAFALSFFVGGSLLSLKDWWALSALAALIMARLVNIILIKRRSQLGWKGASEPGVKGDLLVLLSQDRWVRIRGLVDDLKAVASGQWLRELTTLETFSANFATVLVYLSVALSSNASNVGSLLLAGLLLGSATLLGLSNSLTKTLTMFGRTLSIEGEPKQYDRRLTMVKELIEESGRDDWAIGMGMIVASEGNIKKANV